MMAPDCLQKLLSCTADCSNAVNSRAASAQAASFRGTTYTKYTMPLKSPRQQARETPAKGVVPRLLISLSPFCQGEFSCKMIMIYTHVVKTMRNRARSPLDVLNESEASG
jgi:hypothetical protein